MQKRICFEVGGCLIVINEILQLDKKVFPKNINHLFMEIQGLAVIDHVQTQRG